MMENSIKLEQIKKECWHGNAFDCSGNQLTSLTGAPKNVGGDFYCSRNKKNFTAEEVEAVCDVKGHIFI